MDASITSFFPSAFSQVDTPSLSLTVEFLGFEGSGVQVRTGTFQQIPGVSGKSWGDAVQGSHRLGVLF